PAAAAAAEYLFRASAPLFLLGLLRPPTAPAPPAGSQTTPVPAQRPPAACKPAASPAAAPP
ncbi:MAG: dihydrolipoamide succinyltransferase, partial [Hymenobacter sp.]